jgi:predicted DNA-binding transcriptional regulator AlpA
MNAKRPPCAPTPALSDPLVFRHDLARMFNRCTKSIDDLRKKPGFPRPFRLGGTPCWTRSAIERYLAKLQAEAEAGA